MQQVVINVPDNKIDFFIDLANNLGFSVKSSRQKDILSQKQIELTNEARKELKGNPDSFLDWDDARKELHL